MYCNIKYINFVLCAEWLVCLIFREMKTSFGASPIGSRGAAEEASWAHQENEYTEARSSHTRTTVGGPNRSRTRRASDWGMETAGTSRRRNQSPPHRLHPFHLSPHYIQATRIGGIFLVEALDTGSMPPRLRRHL